MAIMSKQWSSVAPIVLSVHNGESSHHLLNYALIVQRNIRYFLIAERIFPSLSLNTSKKNFPKALGSQK